MVPYKKEGDSPSDKDSREAFPDERLRYDARYHWRQENPERGNWPHSVQGSLAILGAVAGHTFHFALIATSVIKYGPVFLLPYCVFLLLVCLPLFYLESSIGQFSSSGLLTCWMVPIFKGVGVAMVAMNVPQTLLQWGHVSTYLYYLHEGVKSSAHNTSLPWTSQDTLNNSAPECDWPGDQGSSPLSAADRFLRCHVNGMWDHPLNDSFANVPILVSSLIVCIIISIISAVGIRAIAWVSTVLVPASLFIILILASMADNLPSAINIWSDYKANQSSQTDISGHWDTDLVLEALVSAILSGGFFVSLYGIVITYSSYNRFHNDIVRDAVIVISLKLVLDLLSVTLVGGFFSQHGLLEPLTSDETLLWPLLGLQDAFSKTTGSHSYVIAFCFAFFFLTLLRLVALFETILTAILDQFPTVRKYRPVLAVGLAVLFYLLGIPLGYAKIGPSLVADILHGLLIPGWTMLFLTLLCFMVYGIHTYFKHRHDVAAMKRWNLFCIPAVMTWYCMAYPLLILPVLLVGSVGLLFYTFFPQGPASHVYSLTAVFPFLLLIITVVVQVSLSLVKKRPDWKTLLGVRPSWEPRLEVHKQRAARFARLNPYSTSRYCDVTSLPSTGQTEKTSPWV